MLCLTQQLQPDSLTAWICMHVCRCMHSQSQLEAVEWGKAFKQSQEFCGPALSRKPLWFKDSHFNEEKSSSKSAFYQPELWLNGLW